MKKFNNAGPSVTDKHFTLNPLVRIDVENIESLIEDERYFVLHAPRQTGKTTCLLALMHHFNAQKKYRVVYANIEGAQSARGDVTRGIPAVCDALAAAVALYLGDTSLQKWMRDIAPVLAVEQRLTSLLTFWSQNDSRPAVLFLDEVDALVGDTLISLLRQIRAGYVQRPTAFPQTIILCGVRDIRDYRIETKDKEIITGGSAFNIKAESLRLGNFSKEDCIALWQQHTEETGQIFDDAIWNELWEDTRGQPWIVNALGHECTWKDKAARDRTMLITLERYKQAKERLIYSRATHLDALSDKLKEDRVRRIVATLLSGEEFTERFHEDDVQYVEDLGLIRTYPELAIFNRIYREVLPREITYPIQVALHYPQAGYIQPDGRLDMTTLLKAFQQFFRENSEVCLKGFVFYEAGGQLLLQAFLQRIINGGGRINREYGLGLKRTDLFIEWPIDKEKGYLGTVQRIVIELKRWDKGHLEPLLASAKQQLAGYADKSGADELHIVVFDRHPDKLWDEKIWHSKTIQGKWAIDVWGA